MTTRHQISYVNKVPRQDIHHSIDAIGGKNPDGSVWHLPLDGAVAKVLDGTYKFFVATGWAEVDVIVQRADSGHLYLKTEADYFFGNNLLSLPEFPTEGLFSLACAFQ